MTHNVYLRGAAQILGVFALAFLVSHPAFADFQGGLTTATSKMTAIKTAAVTIAGIGAIIYLLFKAVQAWTGRCEWSEFLISCVWVAAAGGAATLANWLYTEVFS